MIWKVAGILSLCAAPLAAEPLIVDNGRLFVNATVNGTATEALLDSGAEASLVDPLLAGRAKLDAGQEVELKGSGGVQKARFVSGVTLGAGGLSIPNRDIVISDLADLSARLIKRPTQMIIGRELFDSGRIRVDIEGSTWAVLADGETPKGIAMPLQKHAGIEATPVTVNGVKLLADVDLGNGSRVLISQAMAEKLGLKSVGKASGGGIGGAIERDLVILDRLEVAGKTFTKVEAAVDPLANAGELNIGTSILRHFVVTTDFPAKIVYLEPRSTR